MAEIMLNEYAMVSDRVIERKRIGINPKDIVSPCPFSDGHGDFVATTMGVGVMHDNVPCIYKLVNLPSGASVDVWMGVQDNEFVDVRTRVDHIYTILTDKIIGGYKLKLVARSTEVEYENWTIARGLGGERIIYVVEPSIFDEWCSLKRQFI